MADPAVVGGSVGIGATIASAILFVVRHLEIKQRFNNGGTSNAAKLDELIGIAKEIRGASQETASGIRILLDRPRNPQ